MDGIAAWMLAKESMTGVRARVAPYLRGQAPPGAGLAPPAPQMPL